MFAFLGGIMLSSGVVIAIPNIAPSDMGDDTVTLTGTPADNFPDDQRPQFCSSGGSALSNDYVTEYDIPTECTQPLSIAVDPTGSVWFAQTNTGNVANFDPQTESFTEFDNKIWPDKLRSMMWGMDYASDGSVWYTDEATDSLWQFSTLTKEYERLPFPVMENQTALPQRIEIDGSQIIVNDFTGGKLVFYDYTQKGEELRYLAIPSPLAESVTSDFAIDENDFVWYTNWIPYGNGILVKFDYPAYQKSELVEGQLLSDFIQFYQFPDNMSTPNGVELSPDGKIWIADTTSSSVFSFDEATEQFTQYVTSKPHVSTYGNATGIIKDPISRPYWIEAHNDDIIFNEQTANRIGVLSPESGKLVEYMIPSKNPKWSDCEMIPDCGLAQIFSFAPHNDKVWFTEWVENKIGVVDMAKTLPNDITLDTDEITIYDGQSTQVMATITPLASDDAVLLQSTNAAKYDDLTISFDEKLVSLDSVKNIPVTITASDSALPGIYNVLITTASDDVNVSAFLTVTIASS